MAMKRVWFLLLLLLVAVGCSRNLEQPLPPAGGGEEEIKAVLPVVAGDLPARDPFLAQQGEAVARDAAQVPATGRDPFGRTADEPGSEQEAVAVTGSGRDPFREGGEQPPVEEPDGPLPAGRVEIELFVRTRCWLDVFVDGERVLRDNVSAGETLRWQGGRVELAQVGRSWAVELKVNGRDVGLLEELAAEFDRGPLVRSGARITLQRKYPGGVLVGLLFSATE